MRRREEMKMTVEEDKEKREFQEKKIRINEKWRRVEWNILYKG